MESVTLTDLEGRRAKVELLSEDGDQQLIRLENGQTVSLPEDALVKQHTGDYYLLLKLSELETAERAADVPDTGSDVESVEEAVVPVVEERAVVRKRRVEGATVRIRKEVTETEEVVDEPLASEEVTVERVKLGRVVEEAESIRTEGNTTVIPLYEEVLVVEKRLVLTEEVRVTKRQVEKREPQTVTLRREEVSVERVSPEEGPKEEVVEGNEQH